MSRFTDLQTARATWRSAHIDYYRMCQLHLNRFVSQFREYLEVPEYYNETHGGGAEVKRRRYVSLLKALPGEGEHEFEYEKIPEGQTVVDLIKDDNQNWVAGVSVVVDNAMNTWPKDSFFFPLNFSIESNICTMRIGGETGKTFRYNINEAEGSQVVFEYIVEWLHRLFQTPPNEKIQQDRIGFVRHEER